VSVQDAADDQGGGAHCRVGVDVEAPGAFLAEALTCVALRLEQVRREAKTTTATCCRAKSHVSGGSVVKRPK
jgi:hypothetical protein